MKTAFLTKAVLVCLIFSFIGVGQVKAQSTLEYNVLVGEIVAALQQQTHFKFKLEAFDALTNGAVTANTTEINLVLMVTNETNMVLTGVQVMPSMISLKNYPASISADVSNGPFANNGGATSILPLATQMFALNQQPLVLKNTNTHASILAHVNFGVGLVVPSTSVSAAIPTSLDAVIYKPSNDDLIPTVVGNQTSMSNLLNTVNITANQILHVVSSTQQCKSVSLTIKGPGGAGQICGDGGAAKINPQAVCALYGYSGGSVVTGVFAGGPYANDFVLATTPAGSFPITVNGHTTIWQDVPSCNSWAQVTCQQC